MAAESQIEEHPSPEDLAYVEDVARSLALYWHLFLLRGLVVTGFGLFFLFYPSTTVDVLTKVFGSLLIVEGAANLVKLFVVCCCTASLSMLGVYFLMFACNTAAGVLIFVYPDETSSLLITILAAWFVAIGVLQIFLATVFRAAQVRGGSECIIGVVGILYLALGGVLLSNKEEGVRTVVKTIGIVVTIFGVQLLYLALRLKNFKLEDHPDVISEYDASVVRYQDHEVSPIV
jgi:uncharacterized membrane protein HdeD (DUF308 family)